MLHTIEKRPFFAPDFTIIIDGLAFSFADMDSAIRMLRLHEERWESLENPPANMPDKIPGELISYMDGDLSPLFLNIIRPTKFDWRINVFLDTRLHPETVQVFQDTSFWTQGNIGLHFFVTENDDKYIFTAIHRKYKIVNNSESVFVMGNTIGGKMQTVTVKKKFAQDMVKQYLSFFGDEPVYCGLNLRCKNDDVIHNSSLDTKIDFVNFIESTYIGDDPIIQIEPTLNYIDFHKVIGRPDVEDLEDVTTSSHNGLEFVKKVVC